MRILVIVAHPDDEVLGCGGTMARHVAEGDEVHVLFLADGVTSRSAITDDAQEDVLARESAADRAGAVLGVKSSTLLGLPDNQLDSLSMLEIVQKVEAIIGQVDPHFVYTHHDGDLNVDHRIACHAVMTACRPLPGSTVEAIYAFEVLSSTEWGGAGNVFAPNVFVNIEATMELKLQAIDAYAEEMRSFPHARSVEAVKAQAALRGASVGVVSAEAFVLLRGVR